MERVRAARQELVVSRGRLRVVPLPARDESIAEHQQAKAWRERFEVELSELYREWLPKDVRPKDVIETLKIPYKPYWSFGEPLPAVQEGTRDPAGLGHAYLVLTRLIESRLDWAHAIGRGGMLDAAEQRAAEATTRAAKLQRTSRTVLGLALLALVTVVVWGAVSHERKLDLDGRDRVDQVLRAAAASSDPLEGALLLAELAGASEPPSGAARARALLSRPIPSMVWRGGSAPITRAELSHDGSSFLIVSDAVDLWTDAPAPGLPQIRYGPKDLPDRTHVSLLAPASGSPVFGWFSPDWTLVSTLSGDNQLVAWDVRGDPPKAVSTSRTGDSLVASLDGRLTATATGDTVEVFAPPSETPVVSARFDLDKPPPLVFSLDGRFLFVAAGKQVFRLPLPDPSGPHGKVLSKGDLVQMTWNPVTRVNSMNTSDDGTLVAALASREAAIWQTNGTPSGAMATVGPLFFIKEEDVDAAHLAAKATITLGDYTSNSMVLGWSDGTVALATATPALEPGKRSDIAIRILGKHGASVTDVEFDLPLYRSTNRVPSMVVSGSVDGTIQVWKLGPENGAPVTLRAGGDQVLSVRFDEQVRRVVAATEKAAYIWPLEPATLPERWSDLIGVAREISAACLTVHQRVQLLQETPEAASIHTAACEADHGRAPPTASADAGPFP
jgi:WD40 repeat protein